MTDSTTPPDRPGSGDRVDAGDQTRPMPSPPPAWTHAGTQEPGASYGRAAATPLAPAYGGMTGAGAQHSGSPQGWPTQTFESPPVAHPYGSAYAGSRPGGMPPYGPPVDPSPERRRRGRGVGLAALAVAGCLLAGTAGGALGVELADESPTVATRSAGSATASQASAVDGSVQGAAAEIMPSTVVISVTGTTTSGPLGPSRAGGSGSGVVLDTDGHILTNAHVVSSVENATIEVMLPDARVVAAEIIGVDESSDLAVLEVEGVDDLQPAAFADSDALAIGQAVVAVGAPLGLTGTVTEGIVSAVDRPVRTGRSADASTVLDAVQTDAAINPGNSGGPLVNLAGEVVGINSAIATVGGSAGQSGNIGVGFAIPSNDATDIAEQLIADGTAEHASLGISASESDSGRGATVQDVEPGGPAAEAGLEPGDVIVAVADRRVPDLDSLLAAVRDHTPGDAVTLTVLRDGAEQSVKLTLGSRTG